MQCAAVGSRERGGVALGGASLVSAFAWLWAPVVVVLYRDPRCLYYQWACGMVHGADSQECTRTQTSAVTWKYCATYDKPCSQYNTDYTTSTFTPQTSYQGGQCVSAMVEIYAPVYLQSALLSAVLPALLELVLVPWILRQRQQGSSRWVTPRVLWALRQVALNTRAAEELLVQEERKGVVNLGDVNMNMALDKTARNVVERGFGQLVASLLLALTLGVAAPMVGASVAVGAGVQLVHHLHVLGQVATVGRMRCWPAREPDLEGCDRVPWGCGVTVLLTTVLLWVGCSVGFLNSARMALGAMASICGLGSVALCVALWRYRACEKQNVLVLLLVLLLALLWAVFWWSLATMKEREGN